MQGKCSSLCILLLPALLCPAGSLKVVNPLMWSAMLCGANELPAWPVLTPRLWCVWAACDIVSDSFTKGQQWRLGVWCRLNMWQRVPLYGCFTCLFSDCRSTSQVFIFSRNPYSGCYRMFGLCVTSNGRRTGCSLPHAESLACTSLPARWWKVANISTRPAVILLWCVHWQMGNPRSTQMSHIRCSIWQRDIHCYRKVTRFFTIFIVTTSNLYVCIHYIIQWKENAAELFQYIPNNW